MLVLSVYKNIVLVVLVVFLANKFHYNSWITPLHGDHSTMPQTRMNEANEHL